VQVAKSTKQSVPPSEAGAFSGLRSRGTCFSLEVNRFSMIYHSVMTTNIDIQFRYTQHPSENTMRAVAELYDVYGIRRVRLNRAERTVLVEYDATRLNAASVFQMLRRAGLSVSEQISPFPPPATATENTAPAA